jgi:CelD/BcsL family acetyltransferase involved in cellulose biosynthesis
LAQQSLGLRRIDPVGSDLCNTSAAALDPNSDI